MPRETHLQELDLPPLELEFEIQVQQRLSNSQLKKREPKKWRWTPGTRETSPVIGKANTFYIFMNYKYRLLTALVFKFIYCSCIVLLVPHEFKLEFFYDYDSNTPLKDIFILLPLLYQRY